MKLLAFLALFCVSVADAASLAASRHKFDWQSVEHVYAFGDSYSFVQGTRGHANYSFIGDAFNLSFTPAGLLSTEIIPNNTSSDGSNWLEYLTGCFGGLPSRCPRKLWDFAFAGADISGKLLPLHHNFTVPLVDQVTQYLDFASHVLPHPAGKTITAWWIGINDTGDVVNNGTIANWAAFWEREMQALFSAVGAAHTRGGLTSHLFLNVPPEERAPGYNGNATKTAIEKQRVAEFNSALSRHIAAFQRAHADAIVLQHDTHAFFSRILDAPTAYGFTDTSGYCTCTDDSYFWYNTGHPTQKVHRLLADDIRAFLRNASRAEK